MPVPVLIPFVEGSLKKATLAAVETSNGDLDVRPIRLDGDQAYFDLIEHVWSLGQTFLVVEQDIVPHAGALAELLACSSSWCAFPYDYPPFGLYAGMGCAKFSAALLAEFPTAIRAIAGWSDDKHPPRHWCRLDAWMKQWLLDRGVQPHVHLPPVGHVHKGRPAHDCTTPEEAQAILDGPAPQASRRPTFSFLIPTHEDGRPLWRCLDSLAAQIEPDDEVIVIGDTFRGLLPRVERLVQGYDQLYPSRFAYVAFNGGRVSFGHDQLNFGLQLARGDWLSFNDDDDIYAPGAVSTMREAATRAGDRPMLFRFQSYHGGAVFWSVRGRIEENYVGGHCLVCRNLPDRVGRFAPHYQGDYTMIESTVALNGGASNVIWQPEIIAIARPAATILEPAGGSWR